MSKKKTRKEKLDEIYALIQEVFPGEEPADLSKVYVDVKELDRVWARIIHDYIPKNKVESLIHSPDFLLADSDADDCYTWTEELVGHLAGDSYDLIPGKVALAALEKVKRTLGKDPEKTLIMSGPDQLDLVVLREMSHGELDAILAKFRAHLKETKKDHQEEAERKRVKERQSKLHDLATRIGFDNAVRLLEDEVEALKDGEK